MSARLWSPFTEVPGSAYERRPSRTAISTVGATPTDWISLTNAVFGEVASASVTDIEPLYLPAFFTQYESAGQPGDELCPMPFAAKNPGTSRFALMPRPFSIAAAVVKILKIEPAPSPTAENGCGCTVSLFSPSRP